LTLAPSRPIIACMFHTTTCDIGQRPSLNAATGPDHGPPLILLHGVLRGWRDFAPLLPALTTRWRVVSLDHRGHGGSGRAERYYVRDYADDALAFVGRHVPPARAILYGHSLGALCAAAVAAARPDLVAAVILEDPPAASFLDNVRSTPWHPLWAQMRPLAGRLDSVSVLARELAGVRLAGGEKRLGDVRDMTSLRFSARCLRDLDPRVFDPLLAGEWLKGFDYDGTFTGVRCPALILRGEEPLGGMLSRAEAARLAGLMADANAVDVPGAGHLIHWQAAEATARLVLGFLESL
jgi:pimeloyl-ACP methyl ester carboxylesterase